MSTSESHIMSDDEPPVNPYISDNKYPYQKFFGPRPRSGEPTPYAKKILCYAILLFSSLVVMGDAANVTMVDPTGATYWGQILIGLISTLFAMVFLILNLLTHFNRLSRYGLVFGYFTEVIWSMIFIVIWVIGAILSSGTLKSTSSTAEGFSWVALFTSFFATFYAFYTFRESEKPSAVGGANGNADDDEDVFIYG